jgi:hypothetical protein
MNLKIAELHCSGLQMTLRRAPALASRPYLHRVRLCMHLHPTDERPWHKLHATLKVVEKEQGGWVR